MQRGILESVQSGIRTRPSPIFYTLQQSDVLYERHKLGQKGDSKEDTWAKATVRHQDAKVVANTPIRSEIGPSYGQRLQAGNVRSRAPSQYSATMGGGSSGVP